MYNTNYVSNLLIGLICLLAADNITSFIPYGLESVPYKISSIERGIIFDIVLKDSFARNYFSYIQRKNFNDELSYSFHIDKEVKEQYFNGGCYSL